MRPLVPLLLIAAAGCEAAARPAPPPAASRADAAPIVSPARTEAAPRGGSAPAALPGADAFAGGGHKVAGLAAGPGGELHAVFLSDSDDDGRGDRVLYARFDGARWTEPVPLDESRTRSEEARIVVDGDGRVHVLWLEGRHASEPRLLTDVAHRVFHRGRWSRAETLYHEPSRFGIPHAYLDATTDERGAVHLLHARTDRGFAHRVLDGRRWQSASDDEPGGGYVSWNAAKTLDYVYVAAQTAAGELRANSDVWYRAPGVAPARVYRGEGYSYEPRLLTDARGVRHVVWREGARALRSERVLHATSIDGAAWSAPREIAAGLAGAPHALRLAADASGAPHLTFAANTAGGPRHFHLRLDDDAGEAAPLFPGLPSPAGGLETATDASGRLHALWKTGDGIYRHAVLHP